MSGMLLSRPASLIRERVSSRLYTRARMELAGRWERALGQRAAIRGSAARLAAALVAATFPRGRRRPWLQNRSC